MKLGKETGMLKLGPDGYGSLDFKGNGKQLADFKAVRSRLAHYLIYGLLLESLWLLGKREVVL